MNDLQKFLNDFLDSSNRTILFATMIALIVILIVLVSLVQKKKKKKRLKEVEDGSEFNEDFNPEPESSENSNENSDESSSDENFSPELEASEISNDNSIEISNDNSNDESFSPELEASEISNDNSIEISNDNSNDESFSAEPIEEPESSDGFNTDSAEYDLIPDNSDMEALLSEEDNEDPYSVEAIEDFFGNLGKQEIGNAKDIANELEDPEEEKEETTEEPVELILHDQISVEEEKKEEEEKEKTPEEKHTAITLVDGSDRVMVSIGEKFEAKHTKSFTIEVKDKPELTIALQDGFVFDGRIHFFVNFSEALAKRVSLKDITEITGSKGSYSGYEIKLEITDKGDLETIDCTRSFNYKKIRNAVLIIQLDLE